METRIKPDGRHLEPLALDALRAGEGAPEDATHVASCPRCRAALAKIVLLQETLTRAQLRIPVVPRDLELRILRGYRDSFSNTAQPVIPALVRRWALPALGAAAATALLLTVNPIRLGDPGSVPHYSAPVAVVQAPDPVLSPQWAGRGADIRIPPPPRAGEKIKASGPEQVAIATAPDELRVPAPGRSVDIVDAFRLACALRDGRQTGSGWDADGNGFVDDADVRLLARRAVTL